LEQKNNYAINTSLICRDAPTKATVMQFKGFIGLIAPILPFSVGLAGRPYNSVLNITVLDCGSKRSYIDGVQYGCVSWSYVDDVSTSVVSVRHL